MSLYADHSENSEHSDDASRAQAGERPEDGRRETYATPGPISLRLVVPAGAVQLTAGQVSETSVRVDPMRSSRGSDRREASGTVIARDGDEIRVEAPDHARTLRRTGEIRVSVTVPEGSALHATLAAAELRAGGSLGDCAVKVASGAVRLESVDALDLKSASGEVGVDRVAGNAEVSTASGAVRLTRVDGDARITTASGGVDVGRVSGELGLRTVSGDAEVGALAVSGSIATKSGEIAVGAVEGSVSAKTVSGDMRFGVPEGAAAWLELNSLSGDVRTGLDESAPPGQQEWRVRIRASSTSGDIAVRRAF